jgi:hypothetical protein
MILITTGMRVGGLVKIKISHVCSIKDNNINVFNQGRTLEKGNKWFEFVINPEVQDLIKKWVLESRKSNSDYLFPSTTTKSGHMAANTIRSRFKKICDKCGISGKHLHLHSLRHSYAHILLKCGNNISVISKLLNHSDTQTTEKFYLKENISEIVDRAKIPWLNPDNKPNVDHTDTNKSNNNISNLRWCTQNENCRNVPITKRNTSGVKGLSWHKNRNKWRVQIDHEGKRYHLGSFIDKDEAIKARKLKANELFGEFTNECEKIVNLNIKIPKNTKLNININIEDDDEEYRMLEQELTDKINN